MKRDVAQHRWLLLQVFLFSSEQVCPQVAPNCDCDVPFWQQIRVDLQHMRSTEGCPSTGMDKLCRRGTDYLGEAGKSEKNVFGYGTCAAGIVSVGAACACARRRSVQALDGMQYAMLALGSALKCIDLSGWPFSLAEVLGNYYFFKVEHVLCSPGVPLHNNPGCPGIVDWSWSNEASLFLPLLGAGQKNGTAHHVAGLWQWLWAGITHEANFWLAKVQALYDKGQGHWVSAISTEYPQWITDSLCAKVEGKDAPAVLHAGSGPVDLFSLKCNHQTISVIHADALAQTYWRIYQKYRIRPPQLPVQCFLEKLNHCFPRGFFHAVLVVNALDHAIDAVAALKGIMAVTCIGCKIMLIHTQKESEIQQYSGMHLWSLDVDSSLTLPRLILRYRRHRRIDVSAMFAHEVAVVR